MKVAEYVSLLQNSLGSAPLWVAGFNNDCFGYLPTARIVRERGHEAIGVTLWIGERSSQQVAIVSFMKPALPGCGNVHSPST